MRHRDGLRSLDGGTPGAGSHWRWFPWAIAAAMGVVIAVNVGMVFAAMHSFPGAAGSDGFDLSNHYDRVLEQTRQQAQLGWDVQVQADAGGRPVLSLTGRAGVPLSGALIRASAERPVGPERSTALAFQEVAPGRYLASAALDQPGQWELRLSVRIQGQRFLATRRIVIR